MSRTHAADEGGARPPRTLARVVHQKTRPEVGFHLSVIGLCAGLLLIGLPLLASGCGNAAQEQAYARAQQAERAFTVESAPAIIAEYKRVIALEPGSGWAKKAAARIQTVEARLKTEETRKDVFQEHGVD